MAWLLLLLAGLFEVVWAVLLKYADGFTKVIPTTATLLSMTISVWLLSISMKTIPLGTAYAVWTGIGTVGTVIYGIFFFNDSAELLRILCIGFILIGIIGLKLLH